MLTSRATLSLLVCLLITLATPLYAIDECWNEYKVEVRGKICYSAVPDFSGTYYRVSCNGVPENGCGGCSPIGEPVYVSYVDIQTGYKCGIVGATITPSTIMMGMSGSFQAWWNQYVEASGAGSSGPVNSYVINKGGWSSCRPRQSTSTVPLDGYPGVSFEQTVHWTSIGGNWCTRDVSIIGTGDL